MTPPTLGDFSRALIERLDAGQAVVGVVGLGYVGLPLVGAFHAAGLRVVGFDVDPHKVERLLRGESYIGHIPAERIAAMRVGDRFLPTTDFARAAACDAVAICVPTPLAEHREPDLSYVVATGRSLAPRLRPGGLVILESTTYPGTTRDVLRPVLEAGSGLVAGKDLLLAYSPEREDPGNPRYAAGSIPKVVGGFDPESLAAATALYRRVAPEVIPVERLEVAEACKILENTYRAVNIALVNELKQLFDRMGLSVWDVIAAAKTKPFGFQAFYPGPGLGGHCIPIDPFYLTWLARRYDFNTRFIELAGEINSSMPRYVVERTMRALNDRGRAVRGSRVGVIGIAYKKDVDDPRESPAFPILEELLALGAEVSYHDPHVPTLPKMRRHRLALDSTAFSAAWLAAQDAVVVVTDHSAVDWEAVVRHARLVIDPRNACGKIPSPREHVVN